MFRVRNDREIAIPNGGLTAKRRRGSREKIQRTGEMLRAFKCNPGRRGGRDPANRDPANRRSKLAIQTTAKRNGGRNGGGGNVKKIYETVGCCGRLSANISHLSQEPSDHDPRAHVASLHVYTGSLVCTRSVPF